MLEASGHFVAGVDRNAAAKALSWSLVSAKASQHVGPQGPQLGRTMNCLWITLADPDPATNGQLIYSEGLIRAVHAAGLSLCVLGLSRAEKSTKPTDSRGLAWRLVKEEKLPRWRRLLHGKPEVAIRGVSMMQTLGRALEAGTWDVIVFDSICSGWAVDAVRNHLARSRRSPKVVYLAHNHEVTAAQRIAAESRGMRRIVKQVDLLKVRRLERSLIAMADLVTSNTPEDCRRFVADAAGTPVAFLPPGYGGHRIVSRTIDASIPRRAVVVGSFDWPPKRVALERFLATAASTLSASGVQLQFVGEIDTDYLVGLRQRYPSVDFVGRVEDVLPYMAAARLALVIDLLGGFKLKGLDYVFNRMPILAMRVALPGMPLKDGDSIGFFDSHADLAAEVVRLIDDFDTLNRRQKVAFDACAARFDWNRIGQHLVGHIQRVSRRPARRTSVHPVSGSVEAAAD
ncbi:MAG: glycosyltransferase [Proteobacteria bacterium]|nr:glycosyltransferase [Pseudomonadota bacterium]